MPILGDMHLLRKWLEETETSQTSLANDLGVSQPTVWEWLNGDCLPSPKNLRRLSDKTGISIDALLASEAKKPRLSTTSRSVG